jgi:hypothetical protein
MTDRSYTIKETARVSGLTEDTLRYYERVGLVGPIGRSSGGHRRYNGRDVPTQRDVSEGAVEYLRTHGACYGVIFPVNTPR